MKTYFENLKDVVCGTADYIKNVLINFELYIKCIIIIKR